MWVALVEFRRDPTRPTENRIPLGVAMGFESRDERTRLLVLWTRDRTDFSENERALLGPSYRRLLLERTDYIQNAFEQAVSGTSRPLEALKKFSDANRASLLVTEPRKIDSPRWSFGVSVKARVRDAFQEVTAAFLAGARPQDFEAARWKRFLVNRSAPATIPDPWTLGRRFNGRSWDASYA